MEKGSGVVMCCTFGDQNDIEWYQAHDLRCGWPSTNLRR